MKGKALKKPQGKPIKEITSAGEAFQNSLIKIDPKEPKVKPTFLRPNPNGANQYNLDPRQKLCWELYVTPGTDYFSNARKSGIKAGYEVDYADQITSSEWFKDRIRRLNLYSKGVMVLEETLLTEHIVQKIGMFGPIIDPVKKEYVYEVDSSILALKNKAATFVTQTLGKDDGFSSRNEVTGKDGKEFLGVPILGVDFQKIIDAEDEPITIEPASNV